MSLMFDLVRNFATPASWLHPHGRDVSVPETVAASLTMAFGSRVQ